MIQRKPDIGRGATRPPRHFALHCGDEASYQHRRPSCGRRPALGEALAGHVHTRDAFRRETFALPREAAREKAREMFRRFPKAAYMTEIESWRVLPGDRIEFTMRRLPSAD